eukprot:TRINITY_DN10747_c0_g1_i1.p1 TRINITY_DN10747_c0_g1~~TRINITY_DN10747_c0_g1_i1.p1  ORF type:complete len:338 (-),score=106.44 TRINITY_DN10747_c0_g1_i1:34-1047(-)
MENLNISPTKRTREEASLDEDYIYDSLEEESLGSPSKKRKLSGLETVSDEEIEAVVNASFFNEEMGEHEFVVGESESEEEYVPNEESCDELDQTMDDLQEFQAASAVAHELQIGSLDEALLNVGSFDYLQSWIDDKLSGASNEEKAFYEDTTRELDMIDLKIAQGIKQLFGTIVGAGNGIVASSGIVTYLKTILNKFIALAVQTAGEHTLSRDGVETTVEDMVEAMKVLGRPVYYGVDELGDDGEEDSFSVFDVATFKKLVDFAHSSSFVMEEEVYEIVQNASEDILSTLLQTCVSLSQTYKGSVNLEVNDINTVLRIWNQHPGAEPLVNRLSTLVY